MRPIDVPDLIPTFSPFCLLDLVSLVVFPPVFCNVGSGNREWDQIGTGHEGKDPIRFHFPRPVGAGGSATSLDEGPTWLRPQFPPVEAGVHAIIPQMRSWSFSEHTNGSGVLAPEIFVRGTFGQVRKPEGFVRKKRCCASTERPPREMLGAHPTRPVGGLHRGRTLCLH